MIRHDVAIVSQASGLTTGTVRKRLGRTLPKRARLIGQKHHQNSNAVNNELTSKLFKMRLSKKTANRTRHNHTRSKTHELTNERARANRASRQFGNCLLNLRDGEFHNLSRTTTVDKTHVGICTFADQESSWGQTDAKYGPWRKMSI